MTSSTMKSLRIPTHLIDQIKSRGENASDGIRESLERYLYLMERARATLRDKLTETDLLACVALGNGTIFAAHDLDGLLANAEDAYPAEAGGVTQADLEGLRERLRGLTLTEHAALVDAVERFWRAHRTGMTIDLNGLLD